MRKLKSEKATTFLGKYQTGCFDCNFVFKVKIIVDDRDALMSASLMFALVFLGSFLSALGEG